MSPMPPARNGWVHWLSPTTLASGTQKSEVNNGLTTKPEVKDVHTVKAQFELQTLDDSYPAEDVMCSKKAANTLMYVVSACKKIRKSSTDPLHFVVHTEPLFPEAAVSMYNVVPEFSLEDFENMDVTFTGDTDILKQRFSVIDLHGLDDVPVVVPNVRDADGSLIHPSEYSKQLDKGTPVAVEVLLQLTKTALPNGIGMPADPIGKHKADAPPAHVGPTRKAAKMAGANM
ncbi:uncharacterized protein EDB93DRAFT_1103007 [Suillus bovinus]|uniref:uncharacterized protein n=1 Tax=Suillus bovinus TaxID=48563 RepID=UPI001B87A7DB|nr:uncharacterized protein EDB93DRAFT_1103007 [Suillus bovinus]KAG2151555.1 hypothetical protein EDB93DRAFT_1103007 [Suillus bovinus]